jgi:hypothetical protein
MTSSRELVMVTLTVSYPKVKIYAAWTSLPLTAVDMP